MFTTQKEDPQKSEAKTAESAVMNIREAFPVSVPLVDMMQRFETMRLSRRLICPVRALP